MAYYILFCEEYSIKLFQSGTAVVIAGHSKGSDSDGSQSHSKPCQPIGICVEFDPDIYVTDSGSGAVKQTFDRNCRVPWKVTSPGESF